MRNKTTTRRDFLNRSALTAAGMIVVPRFAHGSFLPEPEQATPKHGLLFDAGDLPRMLETVRQPRFAEFWKSLRQADLEADRTFLTKELRFDSHVKHLLQARQILERTSFVYALTGDRKQAELAALAIDRILQYKKWDYFLEGGEFTIGLQRAPETTIAMSCAREWLDDVLSAETKKEMERQIAEKGAAACYRTLYGMKYPDRVRGWGFDPESDYKLRFNLSRWPIILNATNLKVIPIAGLAVAGCLLHGKHPEAGRWVELAVQSAKAFSVMFGTDGCYDEGVGYWGYTAEHLAMCVDVVRRKLGMDLRTIINFPGTVRYGLGMFMRTVGRLDDCVNFGDAWTMGDISVAAWTAREFRDPIAQHVANTVGPIKSHLTVIWFDPSLETQAPPRELHQIRFANDLVVARTGWDEGDTTVALRSGGPANHEHADRNSVIFKAYGERLFHDPFHAAYSYTDPLWVLRLTDAHTAVLINGKGHQYHDGHEGTNASLAEAKVVDYRTAPSYVIVTSDATEAYRLVNPAVQIVRRTIVFLRPDVLLLFDRIRMNAGTATVELRFQVDNSDGKGTVEAHGQSFHIGRPHASLRAAVEGGGSYMVRTGALAVPAELGVFPFAEIESADAAEHLLLTVCTAAAQGVDHGQLAATKDGKNWRVAGKHSNREIDVRINIAEDIPEVTMP